MAPVPPFGRRPSLVERLQRRFAKVLCGYWRISRWLYGAIFAAVFSWLVESAISSGSQSLPELLSSPAARAIAGVPLPITAAALLAVGGSLLVAGRTARDQPYYDLLDATADGYPEARQQYGGGLAQLRESGPARVEQSGSASPDARLMVVDNELYTERSSAFAVYTEFVRQQDKRILLIVGRGGSGKSTFLLRRMGELTGELRSGDTDFRPHPCVFVNCKFDPITATNPLTKIVEKQLRVENLSAALEKGVRGRHDRALVVFVDAVNENVAPEGDDINVHLTNFARDFLSGEREVYLCLTVRETFWDEQCRRRASNPNSPQFGWLTHVYLPPHGSSAGGETAGPTELVSVPLKDFDDRAEFDEAYQRHRRVYEITGEITDDRTRQICRNPLLLRIFSMAFRGKDIRDLAVARDLVRDLDIFDAYAGQALNRIADQIGLAATPVRNGETPAHRAIRGLLLELALGTVDRGRQSLSSDEVFAIAQERAPEALYVRDQRRIDTSDGLFQKDSPLQGILDEGIVLESRLGRVPGRGQNTEIHFVFERYLEYCIGRGLVRRWRLAHLSREQILHQFRGLMKRHAELRAHSFDNLAQGLAVAVLVAEQPEEHLPPLPPRLHLDLLDVLVRDADFLWNQLACRVIQQLRTFNRPRGADAGSGYPDVEPLLAFLDELAKKNDFVLRWGVERALVSAVEAGEGGAVLRHLQTWLDPAAAFAQRLFAAESVGFLFQQRADYQASGVVVLRQAIESAADLGFWIIRSITFSIGTMMSAVRDRSGPARPEAEGEGEGERELRALSETLLRLGRNWWDRSVVIAGQIEYDCARGGMARWLQWPWATESGWTKVNAALAVEHACRRGGATIESIEMLRLLRQSSSRYDPHLSWAIWQVSQHAVADDRYPKVVRDAAAGLRTELADEAKRRLDDPRAGWITDDEAPDAPGMPDAFPTPVALVYHPEYGHTDLHNHPESKERVQAILDALEASHGVDEADRTDLWTYLSPYRLRKWDAEDFLRHAHPPEWIHRVQELSRQLATEDKPNVVLESDLEVRAGSYEGAALAVRGAVCAVDLVTRVPSVRLAVALVRPPGHLAGNKICIFNNVAIAARHAQQLLAEVGVAEPRVLIVDVDAHHGKSTQDIFYADASVLYFSTHQAGVHPGTGLFGERGTGAGAGYTVNVPIPPGSGDEVYATVLHRVLDTVLAGFHPDLILVSLGLDAHHADSFSQLEMTERSYRELASVLRRHQRQNPSVKVMAAFEGGYDLPSMGRCVLDFMSVFGDAPAPAHSVPRGRPSPLDRYLVQGDEETREGLSAADHKWLMDLDRLQDELKQQWPHQTSQP
ncbi:MAG TPA: hypothetical protein VFY84_16890 [Jiangellales bacterium]|nr:hypothetical protein [Jiangellales bacterium]